MNVPKFKLFRDVDIRVYWIDPVSGEEKSGLLWNYTWVDSVMSESLNNDRVIDAHYYEWDIKGDDGHQYTFPETDLYLDPQTKESN